MMEKILFSSKKDCRWIFSDDRRVLNGPKPALNSNCRFLLFPHAGGSPSFYRSWARLIPDYCEYWVAMYPGRDDRFTENMYASVVAAAQEIHDVFSGLEQSKDLIVFGHSLGSSIAYEFCLLLQKKNYKNLKYLCVSGRQEPSHNIISMENLLLLDNKDLLTSIAANYGGISRIVTDNDDMVDLIAHILRSDLRMSINYKPDHRDKLSCPIIAFSGKSDEGATPDKMVSWKSYTQSNFIINSYAGGHFFIEQNKEDIINDIFGLKSRN